MPGGDASGSPRFPAAEAHPQFRPGVRVPKTFHPHRNRIPAHSALAAPEAPAFPRQRRTPDSARASEFRKPSTRIGTGFLRIQPSLLRKPPLSRGRGALRIPFGLLFAGTRWLRTRPPALRHPGHRHLTPGPHHTQSPLCGPGPGNDPPAPHAPENDERQPLERLPSDWISLPEN